jgi:hypothetical protein
MSSRAVEWGLLDPATNPARVGDLVSVEAGGMPIYRVIALARGQAKVSGQRRTSVEDMSLDRFRWRGTLTDAQA